MAKDFFKYGLSGKISQNLVTLEIPDVMTKISSALILWMAFANVCKYLPTYDTMVMYK